MESSFHYLMMVNQIRFYKTAYAALEGTGLTLGQPKILNYLYQHDGSLQKEIASGCCINPATVTSLLLRMEASGLIMRKSADLDKRSHSVYLTDKGKELSFVVRTAFKQAEASAFKGFDDEQKQQFITMLAKTNENLNQNQK